MIKSIDLLRHPIRGYELIVDQDEQFAELLTHENIKMKKAIVNGRNVFEVPNVPKIWDILFDFTRHKGTLVSIRSIDELDKNIEELLK